MTKKTIAIIAAISFSVPLMLSANNITNNINEENIKKEKKLTSKEQENYLLACWPKCRGTDEPKRYKEKNKSNIKDDKKVKKIRI